MAATQPPTADARTGLEPTLSLAIVPFLFAASAVLYVQIFDRPNCQVDTPFSALFFILLLSYLTSRSLRYHDLHVASDQPRNATIFPRWSFLVLTFSPSLLTALYQWGKCTRSIFIQWNTVVPTYFLIFGAVAVAFIVAISVTFDIPIKSSHDTRRGISKYLSMPVMLISMFLVLGSDSMFSYLTDFLSKITLSYVIQIRYAILGVVILLIVVDALIILSPMLAEARKRIDGLADKFFSPRQLAVKEEIIGTIAMLALLNGVIVVIRYIFQFSLWVALSGLFFLQSLVVSAWRFVVNAGTKFAIIISIGMVISCLLTFDFLNVLGDVRVLLLSGATSTKIIMLFSFLFFYLLWFCATYGYVARPEAFMLTAIPDGAAIVAGFAVMGVWISSLLTHALATLASAGYPIMFYAPAFVGAASLGGFFWVVFVLLLVFSVAGLVWKWPKAA